MIGMFVHGVIVHERDWYTMYSRFCDLVEFICICPCSCRVWDIGTCILRVIVSDNLWLGMYFIVIMTVFDWDVNVLVSVKVLNLPSVYYTRNHEWQNTSSFFRSLVVHGLWEIAAMYLYFVHHVYTRNICFWMREKTCITYGSMIHHELLFRMIQHPHLGMVLNCWLTSVGLVRHCKWWQCACDSVSLTLIFEEKKN